MRLLGITNRGLLVIGVLVACLWGVIFAERAIVEQAQREHYEFMQSLPAIPSPRQAEPAHQAKPATLHELQVAYG